MCFAVLGGQFTYAPLTSSAVRHTKGTTCRIAQACKDIVRIETSTSVERSISCSARHGKTSGLRFSAWVDEWRPDAEPDAEVSEDDGP